MTFLGVVQENNAILNQQNILKLIASVGKSYFSLSLP
jgi:hypothetical protein